MQEINIGSSPNDGTGDKLREFVGIVKDNFIELTPNYKEFVANVTYSESDVIINSPLIVGQIYYIESLSLGDNFSNVGFDVSNFYFTATGEYPISWTSSVLKLVNLNVNVYKNTFESIEIFPIRSEAVNLNISSEIDFEPENTLLYGNDTYSILDGEITMEYSNSIFQIKRYL